MENAIVKQDETVQPFNANIFCSMDGETQEERLRIYAAVNDAQSLEEFIGQPINMTDIVIQPVQTVNGQTGEIEVRNRIVLIDDAGNAYGCMSTGVETCIRNLFAIVGAAPWNPGITVVPQKKQGRNGFKFTTLEIA